MKNNVAETSPDHSEPGLRDRRYPVPAMEIVTALRALAGELPRWRFTGYDAGSGTARLEHDTPIITFTDDITLHLRESGGETTLSGRSASRVGSYDFGMNKRNLRRLLAALDKRLASG
jgi:uncharacterized protein (DUF1499 family)